MFIKTKETNRSSSLALSDSNRIQTYNLLIRSQMLYSVELWSHCFSQLRCKGIAFFWYYKMYWRFFSKKMHFSSFSPIFGEFWGLFDNGQRPTDNGPQTKLRLSESKDCLQVLQKHSNFNKVNGRESVFGACSKSVVRVCCLLTLTAQ